MAEPDAAGAGAYGLIGGSGPTNTRSGSGPTIGGGGKSTAAKIGAKISVDGVHKLVGELDKLLEKLRLVRQEMEGINGLSGGMGMGGGGSTKLGNMVRGFNTVGASTAVKANVLSTPSMAGLSGLAHQRAAAMGTPMSQWPHPPVPPGVAQAAGGGLGGRVAQWAALSMFPGGGRGATMAAGATSLAIAGGYFAYNAVQDRTRRNMAQSAGISASDTLTSSMYGSIGSPMYRTMETDRLSAMGRFSGSRESAQGAFNIGLTYGQTYDTNMDFMNTVARMVQASGGTMTSAEAASSAGLFLDPGVMRIASNRGITPGRDGGRVRNTNQVGLDYLRDFERTMGMGGERLNEVALSNMRSTGNAHRRSMMNLYGIGHDEVDAIIQAGMQSNQFRSRFNRDIDFDSEEDLRRLGMDSNKFGLQNTALESVTAMREGRFFRNQQDSMNRRLGSEMVLQETLGEVEQAFGGLIGRLSEFERVIQALIVAGGALAAGQAVGGLMGGMGGRGAGGLFGRAAGGAGRAMPPPIAGTAGRAAVLAGGGSAARAGLVGGTRSVGGAGLLMSGGMVAHNADSGMDIAGAGLMGAGGAALLGLGPAGIAAAGIGMAGYAAVNYFKGRQATDVEEGYLSALSMSEADLVNSFSSYTSGTEADGGGAFGGAGPRERGRFDAWQVRRGALIAAFLASGHEGAMHGKSQAEQVEFARAAGSAAAFFSDPDKVRSDQLWRMSVDTTMDMISTIRRADGGEDLYKRYFGGASSPFDLVPLDTDEARSLVGSEADMVGNAFQSGFDELRGDGEFEESSNPWHGADRPTRDWRQRSASFANMDPRMEARLSRLLEAANGQLWLGEGYRSPASQERMFLDRHVVDPNGPISYKGQRWRRVRGAPAAPPGRSMHEIGLAADLVGPAVNNGWLEANAAKFGLKTFTNVNNEPWHVQLMELPNSRAELEKKGGIEAFELEPVGGTEDGHDHGSSGGWSGGGGGMAAASGVGFDIVAEFGRQISGGGGWGGTAASTTAGDYSIGATGPGGALSPEDVARLAHQAGFRGQDLIDVVAIAGRESSYRPGALNPDSSTGDLSYGLMQINMIGDLGPSRRRQFGIERNEDLYDPATNMRAAYMLYQQSGNTLHPWGGYKGLSNTYNTDMDAAAAAVANANLPRGDGEFSAGQPTVSGGGGVTITFGDIHISGHNGREVADEFVKHVAPKLEAMAGMAIKRGD